jgi:tetratricopeptide (TPR) repeat protein
VEILEDEDTVKHYKKEGNFETAMAEVFEALASDSMSQLLRLKVLDGNDGNDVLQLKKNHNAFVAQANAHKRFHEYIFLIKAFYHLRVDGDIKQAERQFTIVHNKGQKDPAAEHYISGALLGLGICSYAQNKYQVALKYFADALTKNSGGCHASVRVAIASCFFKLGEYTKAREAVNNAIKMDMASADSFCMLALIEQADAIKNKNKRGEHQLRAYEYWCIAAELDPTCASAYLHQATYHISKWKSIGACEVLNQTWIRVDLSSMGTIEEHDRLLIGGKGSNYVKEFIPEEGNAMITLAHPLSEESVGQSIDVCVKEYGRVLALAGQARNCAKSPYVLSEVLYLEGRVCHERGDTDAAESKYEEALQKWKEMDLAAFALAKIKMSQDNRHRALELFQQVAKRNPDDKDTQAYICLLLAMQEGQVVAFEKLKEFAIDFEFEANLWLIQAELRHKKAQELGVALKCYTAALECVKDTGDHSMIAVILSNIAVLQEGAGKHGVALETMKASLVSYEKCANNDTAYPASFSNGEFEGVFYKWADSSCASVKRGKADSSFEFHGENPALQVGEIVKIDDVLHTIESTSKNGFIAYSPIDVFVVGASCSEGPKSELPLTRKISWKNFNSTTITVCYNYARILEENAKTSAATELYLSILKHNPALIEAYIRMSHISLSKGNTADAVSWACRGLSIDERNSDALVCLADLRARGAHKNDRMAADAIVNELLKSQDGDPRPLVLLGNMRFEDLKGADDEKVMKQCRKYFFTPLSKDPTNVYAANGLGMVCCEYEEYDVASEIFLRAKELGMTASEDINNNLANVHLIQGRVAEAEHLYQLNTKNGTKGSRTLKTGSIAYSSEMSACAQFKQKRHEDAVRTLLRGIHNEPVSRNNLLRFWYNIAHVRANKAHALILTKGVKTVRGVQEAIEEFDAARHLFTILAAEEVPSQHIHSVYNPSQAKQLATHAEGWLSKCETELQSVERTEQANRDERNRRNMDHQERVKKLEEEKASALAAIAEEKAAKERQVAEKQRRLDELKAGWQAAPVVTDKPKSKGKAAKGKDLPVEVAPYDSDDDLDIGSGFNISKKTVGEEEIDSDADDDIFGGGNKRAIESHADDAPSQKKKRVIDSDDEDAQFGDDAAMTAPPTKDVDDLFNSDED